MSPTPKQAAERRKRAAKARVPVKRPFGERMAIDLCHRITGSCFCAKLPSVCPTTASAVHSLVEMTVRRMEYAGRIPPFADQEFRAWVDDILETKTGGKSDAY